MRPSHPRAGGEAALQPVSPLAGEVAHEIRPLRNIHISTGFERLNSTREVRQPTA
jgi:hypothetical protein